MKAQIKITGQLMSVYELFGKLSVNAEDAKDGNFYSKYCFFDSVKAAKEAIKKAYISLKEEDPTDFNLSKSRSNDILTYDAGRAELIKVTQ